MLKQIFEILDKFGNESVKLLKQKHIEAGQSASGETEKGFRHESKEESNSVSLSIMGAAHAEFVDRGRGSGGFPPVFKILKWIDDKGLSGQFEKEYEKRSFAYLIGKKMADEGSYLHRRGMTHAGVKEPISSVFEQHRVEQLRKELGKVLSVEVKSDIIKQFKTEGYGT